MRKKRALEKSGIGRAAAMLAVLALLTGLCSYSLQAANPFKVSFVELPGASGLANNFELAFDRYVVVAPFAASEETPDPDDPYGLNNHFVYLMDTKKPGPGIAFDLSSIDPTGVNPKRVYWPTRVRYDAASGNIFLRGTRYDEVDGEVIAKEVIAYLHVSFDPEQGPKFDSNIVTIDIRGLLGADYCSDAPYEFVTARKGQYLVFTNGAAFFSYNLEQGYINEIGIVPPAEHSEKSRITHLGFDEASNTISICWNKTVEGKDKRVKNLSELYFFELGEKGSVRLIKRVLPEQFGEGVSLTAGSNVVVTSEADKQDATLRVADNAYFVTNTGALAVVDLRSQVDSVRTIQAFPELVQGDTDSPSPRILQYNAEKRTFWMVNRGYVAQIKRPAQGKPGRPGRSIQATSTHEVVEDAAVVIAQLKKGKVGKQKAYSGIFKGEGGLADLVVDSTGQGLISTYSGKLYALSSLDDAEGPKAQLVGEIGPRVDRINYFANRTSVVAINSYEAGDENAAVPGSLVVAKVNDVSAQLSAASVLEMLVPQSGLLKGSTPSIRRPATVRR